MISIIVPIYNSEGYIKDCIESILSQTMTEWELLLINDGSTDSSPELCKIFCDSDDRIKLINKDNGGVSSARNYGLEIAQGEWITFIDSDDTVSPSYLSDLYRHTDEADIDVIVSGWKTKYTEFALEYKSLNRSEFSYFFDCGLNLGYVWGKLFKKSFIDDYQLRFPLGIHWAEDALFIDNVILNAKKAVFTPYINYNYNTRPDSCIHKLNSFKCELLGYREALSIMGKLDLLLNPVRPNSAFGFLWRTVLALYNEYPWRKDRIKVLKSLEINKKRLYYKSSTLKEKITTHLLINRYFLIFDFLMSYKLGRSNNS